MFSSYELEQLQNIDKASTGDILRLVSNMASVALPKATRQGAVINECRDFIKYYRKSNHHAWKAHPNPF